MPNVNIERRRTTPGLRCVMVVVSSAVKGDNPEVLSAREQRCKYLLASGKLPEAIGEYRLLIDACKQFDDQMRLINVTLGLADVLFWVDRQACLQTGQQAVELSRQGVDESIHIHAQGKYAHFENVIAGYRL